MRVHIVVCAALSLCAVTEISAQSLVSDSWTPRELAAGAPAGSYALSGFDTVDPYTGSLSIRLPLLQITGRGEAGYPLLLPIQQKWEVGSYTWGDTWYYPQAVNELATDSYWAPYINRFSPGMLMVRESTDVGKLTVCNSGTGSGYSFYPGKFLTRLTFIDEYGTEHELIDTLTTGEPLSPYSPPNYLPSCNMDPIHGGPNRGTVFRSADASDLLFISDSNIQEQIAVPTSDPELYPVWASGWLLFPNGRKYRIVNGLVTMIEDRNGNRTTLTYGSAGPNKITDSAGRVTEISYADFLSTFQDTITYPGSNGAQRQIVVTYTPMANALASGWTLQTEQQLFPTLDGAPSNAYNPYVPESITLPDQSSYRFAYTSYGEVASITLPTGGMFSYQFPSEGQASSSCSGSPVFCVTTKTIFRRILSRTEYSDGHTPSRQTIYAGTDGSPDQYGNTLVNITDEDGSSNPLRVTKQHYLGDAWAAPGPSGLVYGGGLDGMETLTESLSGSQQLLQQRLQTWTQRPCGSGENCWWTGGTPMDHDPQVCQKFTTLFDVSPSQSAAVLYGYDQYNNATDVYEYDYGKGPAASTSCQTVSAGWTRRTTTSYVPVVYPNYASYNTNNPAASAYLLLLPNDKQVLDPSLGKVAETAYKYDTTSLSNAPNIDGNGHDNTNFSGAGTRGNPTELSRCWNAASCTWYTQKSYYDIAGNRVSSADENGNTSSYSFTDAYSDGINRNTYAFPTTMTD